MSLISLIQARTLDYNVPKNLGTSMHFGHKPEWNVEVESKHENFPSIMTCTYHYTKKKEKTGKSIPRFGVGRIGLGSKYISH